MAGDGRTAKRVTQVGRVRIIPGLGGNRVWVSSKRSEIAWMFASLLDSERQYAASEIDALIRQNLKPEVLDDPLCSPDHIRMAMIEHRFMERDPAGTSYRLSETFIDAFGNRLKRLARDSPDEEMQCPGCWFAKVLRARNLYQHYVKKHVHSQELDEIIRKYFNWNR